MTQIQTPIDGLSPLVVAPAPEAVRSRHAGRRPLQIVVSASSVGYYVRPTEQHGPSRPYPEVLADRLRRHGTEADVINHSKWFHMVHEAFREIQETVVPRGADVVVLNFGILEAESTLLPTMLVRRVYTWKPTTNRLHATLRRWLLLPVHHFHTRMAPRLMRRVPSFRRLSPRRFELELARTVRWLRKERNALVLVLNVNPVGDNVEETLPGTRKSVERYNAIIERVVGEQGDDATRLIDVHSAVAAGNVDGRLVADGIHYTAEGHRVVAGMLEREIRDWLRSSGAGVSSH